MNLLVRAIFIAIMLFVPTAFADKPDVEFFPLPPGAQLPFSEAVRVGHMLYLSGQIGAIPGTSRLVEGGITAETRQTMENIKASLEKLGSSMSEVVKCTVFLADIEEWAAMSEVYISYFPINPPARSALAASGLALGARTEIECIATIR